MLEKNSAEIAFQIERIYIKDISFETSNTPHIFQQAWQPEIDLNLNTTSSQLNKCVYEVLLRVTLTVSLEGAVAFLSEVQQAGIFLLEGMTDTQLTYHLGAYCPYILFPYARECITSLVSRGTFPQINLAPINFETLFMKYMQQQAIEKVNTPLQRKL